MIFDNVQVTADNALGQASQGRNILELCLGLAAALIAAEAVGAMDWLFEMTLAYAKTRVAFGRPVGSFQAVKHQLADLSMLVEASKAMTAAAAEALAGVRQQASDVVSMTRRTWAKQAWKFRRDVFRCTEESDKPGSMTCTCIFAG